MIHLSIGWAYLLASSLFFLGWIFAALFGRQRKDPGLPEWYRELQKFYVDKEDLKAWMERQEREIVQIGHLTYPPDVERRPRLNGRLYQLGRLSIAFDLEK